MQTHGGNQVCETIKQQSPAVAAATQLQLSQANQKNDIHHHEEIGAVTSVSFIQQLVGLHETIGKRVVLGKKVKAQELLSAVATTLFQKCSLRLRNPYIRGALAAHSLVAGLPLCHWCLTVKSFPDNMTSPFKCGWKLNSFNILMSFTYCNPHVHDYRSNGQLRNIFLQISV